MAGATIGVIDIGQQKPVALCSACRAGHKYGFTSSASGAHIVAVYVARAMIHCGNDVEPPPYSAVAYLRQCIRNGSLGLHNVHPNAGIRRPSHRVVLPDSDRFQTEDQRSTEPVWPVLCLDPQCAVNTRKQRRFWILTDITHDFAICRAVGIHRMKHIARFATEPLQIVDRPVSRHHTDGSLFRAPMRRPDRP